MSHAQIHKYTNTAHEEVPERPNMWYILKRRLFKDVFWVSHSCTRSSFTNRRKSYTQGDWTVGPRLQGVFNLGLGQKSNLHLILPFSSLCSASLFQKSTRSGVNTKWKFIPNTFNSFCHQVSGAGNVLPSILSIIKFSNCANAKRQQNGANNKSTKANYLCQAFLTQYLEKSK